MRIAVVAPSSRFSEEAASRVIAIAAIHADRIMFALGADVARLAWGIALAKETRLKAGLDPNGIAFGAYVNAACHDEITTARNLVRGIFFIPWAIPTLIAGLTWKWMYDGTQIGLLNILALRLGLSTDLIQWLGSYSLAPW